jgi:broad specificity phosphatase PhoE
MLTLFLVRHGQTDHSRENQLCGSLDIPLTPDGHRMAQALAEEYSHIPFKAIFASPMIRAVDTAKPLADKLKLPVHTDPGLVEISYGEWEDRAEDEVEATQPERFKAWGAHPDVVGPPGGETGYQIAARATAAIDRIRAQAPDGHVMVVSHKATLRILVCHLLGIPIGEFRRRIGMPVCAVTAFELRPAGPLLKYHGSVSHLPEDLRGARGT